MIIQIVTMNDDLIKKVFQLRYYVYYYTMKFINYKYLDHHNKFLTDELDSKSIIVAAIENNEVVATVRGTLFKYLELDEVRLNERYQIFNAGYLKDSSGELSCLCTQPAHANTRTTMQLFIYLLKHTRDNNLTDIFLEAPHYLLSYYKFFNFHPISEPTLLPGYPTELTLMHANFNKLWSQFEVNC